MVTLVCYDEIRDFQLQQFSYEYVRSFGIDFGEM